MTVRTSRIVITTASLLALGLAGCSTAGSPEPTSGPQTSSPANDPFHIERPKKLAAVTDPCQLLNTGQLQALGSLPPGSQGQAQWGQPDCSWRNDQLTVNIAPDTVQGQGIRWMAKIAGDNSGRPNVNVGGYPAVHYGASNGSCGTYVGTSDKDVFLVNFGVGSAGRGNPEYADACAMSDKIAGMVLENLPPA